MPALNDQHTLDTDEVMEDASRTGYVLLPVSRLQRAPWNYKEDDEAKQGKLRNKIERLGAVVNIVVRWLPGQEHAEGGPVFEACDGNHRVDAYVTSGKEYAMCFNMGNITEAHAQRVAVELNEGDFDPDPLRLAESLARIEEEFGREDFLDTSPFDEQELDEYDELLDFDWDQFDDEPEDEGGGDDGEDDDTVYEAVELVLPEDAYQVWKEAEEAVKDALAEDGRDLHPDPGMMRGQVAELLAAEYLASASAGQAQDEDDGPF